MMNTQKQNTLAGERTQYDMQRQSKFVVDLIDAVRAEILNKLARYEVPENWDGHELRHYIADKFADCVFGTALQGKRLKDYKNTIAISNL